MAKHCKPKGFTRSGLIWDNFARSVLLTDALSHLCLSMVTQLRVNLIATCWRESPHELALHNLGIFQSAFALLVLRQVHAISPKAQAPKIGRFSYDALELQKYTTVHNRMAIAPMFEELTPIYAPPVKGDLNHISHQREESPPPLLYPPLSKCPLLTDRNALLRRL